MAPPIRFGVSAGAASDPGQLVEAARRAEDLGYSSLSMPDHLGGQLSPIPALAAAATATTSLRLTTLVLGNDYRHPAWLAQEAATLDLIADGRLELGIGAGWMRRDYEEAGLDHDRPSVRIARLAESVTILKGLFGPGPFSFVGEHYRVHGLEGHPKPAQSPHPPFLIAGGSEKILTLAGREAQIVGLNPTLAAGVIDARAGVSATPAATDQKLAWIRAGAGDRFDELELHTRVHLAAITDDRRSMADALAAGLGLSPAEAMDSPHALAGTVDECVESVMMWHERWRISYIGLSLDAMEAMAPVVAAVAGT